MDERLFPVTHVKDIPTQYLGTPIETLLRSHNLEGEFDAPASPQLLVSMCMDHRKALLLPDNFSYIVRNAGAFIGDAGFMISFALTVGGVKAIAVIGHNQCGMVSVKTKGSEFINGLKNLSWDQQKAETHFLKGVEKYSINDEVESILTMTQQLKEQYLGILIVPMLYLIEDNKLYLIE